METQEILPIRLYRFHFDGDLNPFIKYTFDQTQNQHDRYGLLHETPPENPLSVMNMHPPELAEKFPDLYAFWMKSANEVTIAEEWQHPEVFMTQLWTNLQRIPNSGHGRHTHPNAVWSSFMNIHCTEPNNLTIFHSGSPSGDEDTVGQQHHYTNKQLNPNFARMMQPSPEGPTDGVNFHVVTHQPGDFIIFRSMYPHSVPPFLPTTVQDIRLSMSANFFPYQSGRSDRATWLRVKPDYDVRPPDGYDRGTGWEHDRKHGKVMMKYDSTDEIINEDD